MLEPRVDRFKPDMNVRKGDSIQISLSFRDNTATLIIGL
jgi:hypothetical protein